MRLALLMTLAIAVSGADVERLTHQASGIVWIVVGKEEIRTDEPSYNVIQLVGEHVDIEAVSQMMLSVRAKLVGTARVVRVSGAHGSYTVTTVFLGRPVSGMEYQVARVVDTNEYEIKKAERWKE